MRAMGNSNATPSIFGWQFQLNAALVVMLENIKDVEAARVEGATEDIEVTLTSGNKIYSQVKAVSEEYNYSRVKEKLEAALRTLDNAAKQPDCEQLIYITNTANPFGNIRTISSFSQHTHRTFDELPSQCQNYVNKIITSKKLQNIDTSKLSVHIIPFFTDNPLEKYKTVRSVVERFLYNISRRITGISDELIEIWHEEFLENAATFDQDVTIKRETLVWPIIVLQSQLYPDEDLLDEYDTSDVEAVMVGYKEFINNKVERFDFSVKVLNDYMSFHSTECSKKKTRNFIDTQWVNYSEDFSESNIPVELSELLTKIVISKIIRNRYLIDDVRRGAGIEL